MIRASRILVPVNGNGTDEEAVALACEIARRSKAEVYAIYVIEVKRTLPLDVDLPPEAAKGDAVLARVEKVSQTYAINLQGEILQARDVGTAIVDEAAERRIDLIVMGLTYKRKFGEFDLGQTTQYVLRNAPCRVWVARAAPATGAAPALAPGAHPERSSH